MDQFPGNGPCSPCYVVAARDDGGDLTSADLTALEGLIPVLDEQASDDVSGPAVSDDGKAAVLITPITVGADNTETAEVVKALRADIADERPGRAHAAGDGRAGLRRRRRHRRSTGPTSPCCS